MLTGDVESRAITGALGRQQARRLKRLTSQTAQAIMTAGPDLLNIFVAAADLLSRVKATGDAEQLATLQKWISAKEAQPIGLGLQQSALFEQYARVIQTLAHQKPLLFFLDDLQWIDTGSAALLLHLSKRLVGYPVLIVGAYRPSEVAMGRDRERHPLDQVINEFQYLFGGTKLDLSQADGQTFVNDLLDSEPNRFDQSFRETLYRQTQGHPLFTVELLRGMQERGDLVQDDDGQWLAQPQLDWQTLPARVEKARQLSPEKESHFFEAELYRLEGELYLSHDRREAEAACCFQQALDIARRQESKGLELRATMSLARLWRDQGKIPEARQALVEIYSWFTEGFKTADLKEAKSLLETLGYKPKPGNRGAETPPSQEKLSSASSSRETEQRAIRQPDD